MRGWAAALVWAVLCSCGGGHGSASGGAGGPGPAGGAGGSATAGAGGSTTDGGAGAGPAGGSSGGGAGGAGGKLLTVRVVHAFVPSGMTTGPTLDIYDDMYGGGLMPSLSGKPVIAGLAYGTISAYVRPRFVEAGGTNVQLVALPAGSSPDDVADAEPLWLGMDDGSHPQVTLLFDTGTPFTSNPLSGISWTNLYEKGDDGLPPPFTQEMGPLAPPPPAGQGEYLVTTLAVDDGLPTSNDDYYFFVDDACAPALNGDTFVPGPLITSTTGNFAEFPASPGAHQISVAPWLDTETPTCSQLLAVRQGTTTVSVAAGQQIIAFVYGSSLADLHLVTAPIAP